MKTTTAENAKNFLRNGGALVCSMLTLYCICIGGFIAGSFWWLNQTYQTISTKAASTAVAVTTQQAAVTSTAIARMTEHAQYKSIDHFDSYSSSFNWIYGTQNNDYWEGSTSIKDGVYIWKVNKVKKTFVWWADFYHGAPVKDFDVYLDVKFVDGVSGAVCGGLVFRKSSKGWDDGAYTFEICNDSLYRVDYHGRDGWENLSNWKYDGVIKPSDWNRVEVHAKGDRFDFSINGKDVLELTDDQQAEGGVAILIEVRDTNPAVIQFDNFGYQTP